MINFNKSVELKEVDLSLEALMKETASETSLCVKINQSSAELIETNFSLEALMKESSSFSEALKPE